MLRRSAWRCCTLFQGFEQGSSAAQERVATLQSLSGTGSLRVGAEFISKFLPGRTVYLSNPTWCALAVLQVDAQAIKEFNRIRGCPRAMYAPERSKCSFSCA